MEERNPGHGSAGQQAVEHHYSLTSDIRTAGCGFLMGVADIIPGVSGGTVALILGIYRRLVSGISRTDGHLLGLVAARRWKAAADYWDLRFLLAVGLGIITGIGCLASVMTWLLAEHRSLTYASFAGLILASILLVGRRVHHWNLQTLGIALAGTLFALRLVTLKAISTPPDSLWYIFLCGCIGITAMILPGISGAFVLVLLHRYFYVVEKLKDFLKGDLRPEIVVPIAVFCVGCLVGLLSFSRVLRWLLTRHEQQTMAALSGFMLGAMYCLWPFQRDLTPEIIDMKRKVFVHSMPSSLNADVTFAVLAFVVSSAAVLLLDRASRFGRHPDESRSRLPEPANESS